MKRLLCLVLACVLALGLIGCVDQHPEDSGAAAADENARLIATSPAVAQICNRLNLDLVGVCQTSGTLPERYQDLPKVGMAMSPDLEILKSLSPDYVLSPSSLQSDLQPKYASIGVKSIFLNLKSVEGMYASIEGLGQKFGREDEAKAMLAEFDAFMDEYRHKNEGKDSPKVLVLMGLPGSYIVATDNSYVGSLVISRAARTSTATATGRSSSPPTPRTCSRRTRTSSCARRTPCPIRCVRCSRRSSRRTTSGSTSAPCRRARSMTSTRPCST